jgi:hypothetical protein
MGWEGPSLPWGLSGPVRSGEFKMGVLSWPDSATTLSSFLFSDQLFQGRSQGEGQMSLYPTCAGWPIPVGSTCFAVSPSQASSIYLGSRYPNIAVSWPLSEVSGGSWGASHCVVLWPNGCPALSFMTSNPSNSLFWEGSGPLPEPLTVGEARFTCIQWNDSLSISLLCPLLLSLLYKAE